MWNWSSGFTEQGSDLMRDRGYEELQGTSRCCPGRTQQGRPANGIRTDEDIKKDPTVAVSDCCSEPGCDMLAGEAAFGFH